MNELRGGFLYSTRFTERTGLIWRLVVLALLCSLIAVVAYLAATTETLDSNSYHYLSDTSSEKFFHKKSISIHGETTFTVDDHAELEEILVPLVGDKSTHEITLVAEIGEIPLRQIYFLSHIENLEIKNAATGEVLYERIAATDKRAQPYFGFGWHTFRCDSNTQIEVTVSGERPARAIDDFCESIYVGDGLVLFNQLFYDNFLQIALAVIILLIGILYISIVVLMRRTIKGVSSHYFSTGTLIITGALCSLIDYRITGLIVFDHVTLNWIDYALQVCINFSLIDYLRSLFDDERLQTVGRIVLATVLVSIAACFALALIGHYGIKECIEIQVPIAVPCILALVICAIIQIFQNPHEGRKQSLLFIPAALMVSIMAVYEVANFVIWGNYIVVVFEVGLLIFAIVQFSILLGISHTKLREAESAERLRANLIESRSKVMLSQLQPHFVNNVLSSIAALCDKDPKLAKEKTITFADFLRENLDLLSKKRVIPFSSELEHVHKFMELEEMRFGDELEYEEDLQYRDFWLPPLCVQSMVENAIRHGILPKEDGGKVTLRTRKSGRFVLIEVIDDGVGFNFATSQRNGHYGLESARKRVSAFPESEFVVESSEGKGTTVRIKLLLGIEKEYN